ncbi:MAG: hypothetical protein ACR2PO_09895 [Methyloligellaceae bacterium]
MAVSRQNILIAVAVGLAVLVWLQRTADAPPNASGQAASDKPTWLDKLAGRDANAGKRDAGSSQAGIPQPRNPLFHVRREALKETVARPLFAPNRRPPQKPKPVAKRPPPKPRAKQNYFRLLGVIRGQRGTIALLSDKRDGRYFRVGPGDYIDGWSIIRVDAEQVTMIHENRTVTLSVTGN